jgi:2-(1,2-epoxy-1,2-dihydrophenyl)acetyl-CoA isomerase
MGSDLEQLKTLLVEREGGVAVIALNRPHHANGLNGQMAAELVRVSSELAGDPGVRAVVLTGNGRFFCAGGDVKEMAGYGAQTAVRVKRLADDVHRAISTFARMKAPLVVAVNGVAAGGGFSLAMVGDLVLASASASFTMAYSAAGLSPDGSSTYFLPRLVGLRKTQNSCSPTDGLMPPRRWPGIWCTRSTPMPRCGRMPLQ